MTLVDTTRFGVRERANQVSRVAILRSTSSVQYDRNGLPARQGAIGALVARHTYQNHARAVDAGDASGDGYADLVVMNSSNIYFFAGSSTGLPMSGTEIGTPSSDGYYGARP